MICHWFWDMCLLIGMYVPVSSAENVGIIQNLFITIAGIVLVVICIRAILRKKKSPAIN